MTATNLGLGGNAIRFMGAYVRNVSTSLGLNTSPSTATITLVEDIPNGVIFTPELPGTFVEIELGAQWRFTGIMQKYTIDVRNISGRQIQVVVNDVRDVMRNIPLIIAPGFSAIADTLSEDSHCSLMDIYGAYDDPVSGLNLSGWIDAGMKWARIAQAINGATLTFPNYEYTLPQQTAHCFHEEFRFTTQTIDAIVNPDHLFNSNLMSLSDMIDDISRKHSFDWFTRAERGPDGIIDVNIHSIDRSVDNTDVDLQTFLNSHANKVVSCSSGLELRNDVACIVMQGACVESLTKVSIRGLANEPIDLVPEGGTNAYVMTETEMRTVLAGKNSWLIWLAIGSEDGGGGGPTRYGGNLAGLPFYPIIDLRKVLNMALSGVNLLKNPERNFPWLISSGIELVGKVYDKLKGHADAVYGKRWVHNDILDDIIDSAWTRDVVAGNQDPNEYFRQDDGRTRAYVEFSNEDAGGAFNLGLANLQNLFGDQNAFRNVTAFGNTFSNVLAGDPINNGTIIPVELYDDFDTAQVSIQTERTNYIWDNPTITNPDIQKHSLYMACTVDKDGTVRIDSPVLESSPSMADLLNMAVLHVKRQNPQIAGNNVPTLAEIKQAQINQNAAALRAQLSHEEDTLNIKRVALEIAAREFLTISQELGAGPNPVVEAAMAELNAARVDFDQYARIVRNTARKVAGAVRLVKGIDENDGEDLNDEEPVDIIRKTFVNIIRHYGVSLFDIYGRCYQPKYAYIPTRSKILRYGPAFPSNLDHESAGRLEIIQDDGFAPWEFGSIAGTQEAMQLKVDNAWSNQRFVQTASMTVEGYPQMNLGDSLGFNSNITNINVSFGSDGVKTSYSLQSFTRKFGELTKDDILQQAVNRTNGTMRNIPQQDKLGYLQKAMFSVNKNFGGAGTIRTISPVKGGSRDLG